MSDQLSRPSSTETAEYAFYLDSEQKKSLKRFIDVQAPYRWNIRRLRLGRVLDLGCGNGRNLVHLDGSGVGIDHNPIFVERCRKLGLEAFEPEEFKYEASRLGPFDTLLLSHVAEHLARNDAEALVLAYRSHLGKDGRLVVITPQARGFASDPTHVMHYNSEEHRRFFSAVGARIDRHFSFPFPFWAGNVFTYNETISIGTFTPSFVPQPT